MNDEWLDTPANRTALLTVLRQIRPHLVKGSFVTLRLTLQIQDGAIQRDMMVEPVYKVRVPDAAGGADNRQLPHPAGPGAARPAYLAGVPKPNVCQKP